jgi:hypothetical protein
MSRGLAPQITPNEQRVLPSQSRTLYEVPAWGDLSTEKIEAMRSRMDAACPELARDVKIRAGDAGLVIEIPGIASEEQIACLRQWLLGEEARRIGSTNSLPKAATSDPVGQPGAIGPAA